MQLRWNPNAKWFNLVKIPMRTYCVSGVDSTKWINRFFRKIGVRVAEEEAES